MQLRESGLDEDAREVLARELAARLHACDGLLVVNGDVALAARVGADGVHLPARQLMTTQLRPAFEWVGASCHTRAELEHAAALGLDYALLGPVQPTTTHPDQAALGWSDFAALCAGLPLPVFALGGLGSADMDRARDAGAHGVAAIRGVWGVAG